MNRYFDTRPGSLPSARIRAVGDEAERSVLFHDRIATGYDAALNARAEDVLARDAFRDLVARNVPRGAAILDFGCGTGLDAIDYDARGYRVFAYDSSPGMIARLTANCGDRRVEAVSRDYSEFPSVLRSWPRPDAVVANFAVLNHIRDLTEWFHFLAPHLSERGCVIVSVLNPLHWTHLLTIRWWRSAMVRDLRAHSVEPVTYLHSIRSILRAARGFELIGRANAGAVVRYRARGGEAIWWGGGNSLRGFLWRTPLRRFLGHFVFLVFRRDA
jgi:SAM-dependent methyltransferase